MAQLFANNASTILNGAINNSTTTIVVLDGAAFPTPGAGDFFTATLVGTDTNGNENAWEIVTVTARSGNTLTVVRGQEGTAAASWANGTRIELRLTAGAIENMGASVEASDTPPSGPSPGDLWFDSVSGNTFIWYDDGTSQQWVAMTNAVPPDGDYLPLTGGTLTGNVVVPSLNGGPLAGLRNKVINGNFDIWQRGTSFSPPSGSGFTADRWLNGGTTTGITMTREAFTAGQTDVPGEPTYFLRIASTGVSSQNLIVQRIEDVRTLAGKTVTLSFWVKGPNGASMTANYPQIRQNFGSGGSTEVTVNGSTVTFTGSWQKVVQTFTLPSIAGKTIGASSYVAVIPVRFDAQAITVDVAQVQLEEGSVATPFEQRPIGLELALCQRYYQRIFASRPGMGVALSATSAQVHVPFVVEMRSTPQALEQSGTAADYTLLRNGVVVVPSSSVPAYVAAGPTSAAVQFTVASGLTAGESVMARSINNAYLGFSAEL